MQAMSQRPTATPQVVIVEVVVPRERVKIVMVVPTEAPVQTPVATRTPFAYTIVASTNTPTRVPAVPTTVAVAERSETPFFTRTPPPAVSLLLPTETATPFLEHTPTPEATPVVAPVTFVCGHVEMVLIGAGKEHEPCITPTPGPAATSTPIPTRTPTAVDTAMPLQMAATAVARSILGATPVPAREVEVAERNLDEKERMLNIINKERRRVGVPEVELGHNTAAQFHAEAALKHCFSSHWGVNGLKPYMRYSVAGGYQSNAENMSGLNYCYSSGEGYRKINVARKVDRAMQGLMGSPGHRRNILRDSHRKVNLGLAWDDYNFKVVQHFEGDYVGFDRLPSIRNGVLAFQGHVYGDAEVEDGRGVSVYVNYDPPPRRLTLGQVSRTYCYDNGRRVASVYPPLEEGWHRSDDEYESEYSPCPDPYDLPAELAPPESPREAHDFWQHAYDASEDRESIGITVRIIDALSWTMSNNQFSVEADISDVLGEYGAGVYTVLLGGEVDGEWIWISQYSIFHGVDVPSLVD